MSCHCRVVVVVHQSTTHALISCINQTLLQGASESSIKLFWPMQNIKIPPQLLPKLWQVRIVEGGDGCGRGWVPVHWHVPTELARCVHASLARIDDVTCLSFIHQLRSRRVCITKACNATCLPVPHHVHFRRLTIIYVTCLSRVLHTSPARYMYIHVRVVYVTHMCAPTIMACTHTHTSTITSRMLDRQARTATRRRCPTSWRRYCACAASITVTCCRCLVWCCAITGRTPCCRTWRTVTLGRFSRTPTAYVESECER